MDEQKNEVMDTWEEEPLLPDEPEPEPPNSDTEPPSGDVAPDAPSETKPPSGNETDPETKPEPGTQPEPDYKALYEGTLDRQNADKYRQVYQEQLSLTGNEAIARMIAKNECGGKEYPLEDASGAPDTSQTDFRAALSEIQSLYPDATEMPQSVMQAFMDGKSLKDAYASYRANADKQTIETLRRENAALKQAASNRAAAPVKSVNSAPETSDPFMKGFDSEW